MGDDTVNCDCIAYEMNGDPREAGDTGSTLAWLTIEQRGNFKGETDMPYFEPNPTSGKPGYRTPKSGKTGGVNSGVPKGERVKAPKVNVPPTVRQPKSPGTTNK